MDFTSKFLELDSDVTVAISELEAECQRLRAELEINRLDMESMERQMRQMLNRIRLADAAERYYQWGCQWRDWIIDQVRIAGRRWALNAMREPDSWPPYEPEWKEGE